MTLKSVMITLYEWILDRLQAVKGSDYDYLHSSCIELQESLSDVETRYCILSSRYAGLEESLKQASEANADLHCKLKQVTFLEGRVQELEIALAKQKIEPKKDNKVEPVLFSRSSWRAIAQQRSIASIPDTEPDSVKQLESKVAKEI
jgi:hypothetical protein